MQVSRAHIRGFTLIEVLVTVAIVGILAAIAYPSYLDSVRKSWRANAASCLAELAQRMERRFTAATPMSYAFEDADAIADFMDNACAQEGDMPDRYSFSFVADPTATAFSLRAVPVDPGSQASDRCGTLTLNQMGQKGADDDVSLCWRR